MKIWKFGKKQEYLAQEIYQLTFKDPILHDYRMRDQMRGAAGAIMDNIAEGFERSSRLEFVNSLGIVKGEVGELKALLYRALDVKYIDQKIFDHLYFKSDEITKMATSLIAYLNKAEIKGQKFKNRQNA